MPRSALAWALWLFVFAFAVPLHAAPTPVAGVDCGCTTVGPYVEPLALVETQPAGGIDTLSPGGKFSVMATPTGAPSGNAAHVSVFKVGDPTPLIDQAEGSSWGFSPDDDRFVLYAFEAGIPYAYLFNLAGAEPSVPIMPRVDVGLGGLVAFSPTGRFAVAMSMSRAGPNLLDIVVVDAATGNLAHDNQIPVYAPSSLSGLPDGQTEVGAVRVGFGPDGDRSFVCAWLTTPGAVVQKNWMLVKLDAPFDALSNGGSNYAFTWGFSPCGDSFGVVTQNTDTHLKEARRYSILTHAFVAGTDYAITDDDSLGVDLTEHFALHGLPPNPGDPQPSASLGGNTADDACPGGGGAPVAPVADFSISGTRRRGIPLSFTDQSSTSKGTLTGYAWKFGDGGTAPDQNPTHAYAATGTYNVSLTVTNSYGLTATKQKTVTVLENQPPVASFTYLPANPNARDVVTFTSTSTDDDTIIETYWTLGADYRSGTIANAMVCAPSVTVNLTVTDSAYQSTSTSLEIPVGGTDRIDVPAGSNLELAANGACPGDTLVLEAGTYPGGVNIAHVNIEGAGQGVSIIQGAGANGWVLTMWPDRGYDPEVLRLKALTVTGGVNVPDNYGYPSGGGIYVAGQGSVELDDVELAHNDGRAGFYHYNSGSEQRILNSRVHDNPNYGALVNVGQVHVVNSAFYANGTGLDVEEGGELVERSDFHDNDGPALVLGDAGGSIVQSRFYGNNTQGGAAAVFASDSSVRFVGDLIASNHHGGLEVDGRAEIVNSTIADNCGPGLRLSEGDGHLFNSIVFGNATDVAGNLADDVSNLVGVEPLFVGDGDFHLSATSPAIDAGDAASVVPEVSEDGDGDDRVLTGTSGTALPDVGWDEWRSGQSSSVLPTLACSAMGGSGGTGAGGTGAGGTSAGGTGGGALGSGGTTSTAGEPGASNDNAGEAGLGGVADGSGGTRTGSSRGGSGGTQHGGGSGGLAGAHDGGASGELAGEGGRVARGGTTSTAGAGAAPSTTPSPRDDTGCSCRTASDSRSGRGHVALALTLFGMFGARRRRNGRAAG